MKEPMSCTERTETIHRMSPQPIVKVLYGAKGHELALGGGTEGKESN